MEEFSKKDKSVLENNTEIRTLDSSERSKKDGNRNRRSFWYRLKNFTVESRKTVIWEGDTIKLVPIPREPVTSVDGAEKQKISLVEDRVEKIVLPSEESIVREVDTGVSVLVPPEITIKEDIENLVSISPDTIVEEQTKEQTVVSSEKLKKGLEKTRNRFWSRLKGFFSFRRGIDDSVLEELEDILISADIGVKPVQKLIHEIREAWEAKTVTETSEIHDFIKNRLKEYLRSWEIDIHYAPTSPTIIMVVGVNGVGKTTAIAKLSNTFIQEGKKVMVAASDTFRAAAVDQLDIWSKRIGAEIVKHQAGSDPAAVAYDAIEASIARDIDVLIIDTAGRLHTHENLMNELSKIKRVVSKRIPGAPHEVLMVLDATTGQNAISQAKMFKQAVDVTGIFLAKLDGTAKGGIVLGMRNEIDIPVKFVGLGEKADDIEKFDPDAFVDALFE
jgi:fused signal recognition particle receptor